MRGDIQQWSIFRSSSVFVSTTADKNIPSPISSGPGSSLPALLWLPLAVPPYFLVTAHHNALTLPGLSHYKDTKIHMKTSISLHKCWVYSLHLPLSQHWAPLESTEDRISYLLHSGCAWVSLTKVPTSTTSFFFPAIPAKKDTSMYVLYVGVNKLD